NLLFSHNARERSHVTVNRFTLKTPSQQFIGVLRSQMILNLSIRIMTERFELVGHVRARDLFFNRDIGVAAGHHRETRIVGKTRGGRLSAESTTEYLYVRPIKRSVDLQQVDHRRNRFESKNANVFGELAGKDGEHPDVCADVKDAIAVAQRDAVLEIDLIAEDIVVKKICFALVLMNDGQAIRQFVTV